MLKNSFKVLRKHLSLYVHIRMLHILVRQILKLFVTGKVLEFNLRGDTAMESVQLHIESETYDVSLENHWKHFSFVMPLDGAFKIVFNKSAERKDSKIFFQDASNFKLEYPEKWQAWECGFFHEIEYCSQVRDGSLAWHGVYQIESIGSTKGI